MNREEVIAAIERAYSFVQPEFLFPVADDLEVRKELEDVLTWVRSAEEPMREKLK